MRTHLRVDGSIGAGVSATVCGRFTSGDAISSALADVSCVNCAHIQALRADFQKSFRPGRIGYGRKFR